MPIQPQQKFLVTGGAGYLGGALCYFLKKQNLDCIAVDRQAMPPWIADISLKKLDLALPQSVEELKKENPITAIFHFAAYALVSESCEYPQKYFYNNVLTTLHVAELARFFKCPIIFSSSCSVYGIPTETPIDENSPKHPVSPYGHSKWISEILLEQYHRLWNIPVVCLRYFNPAGSLDKGRVGESHDPETHLIPVVVEKLLQSKSIPVFGSDFPTLDGTAVRDFIHVEDLIEAHWAAFEFIQKPLFEVFNIGTGKGHSVLEVIEEAATQLNKKPQLDKQLCRPGDPPTLIASVDKAKEILNWTAKRKLSEMILDHATFKKEQMGF